MTSALTFSEPHTSAASVFGDELNAGAFQRKSHRFRIGRSY
jgi:hypothetical protein